MVIFENDFFVIAEKKAGVSFHSEEEAGFVVQTAQMLGIPLYPVHRLDKMTSGVVILAKNPQTAAQFTQMFADRKVEKYYLALSLRKPKKKQGWVKGDMTKSRRGSYKLLATMENPSVTQFLSVSLRPHERFFLVKPHTGKTHQIRVALKSLGSPIAGDMRYASVEEAKMEDRGYLHAYAVRFVLNEELFSFVLRPVKGERFLTEEAQAQMSLWEKPWEFFAKKQEK